MSLIAKDLSISRGGIIVLEGMSFTLEPGGALVLKGPNGIGKTSLLRSLAGLNPVAAGHLSGVQEQAVYSGHLDGIKPQLSVLENLRFWAAVFGRSPRSDSLERALEGFDLGPLKHRPAQFLSAGQKRRLGLARLLLAMRPIWLLDEPTISLDQASVAGFSQAVKAHLANGGMAVIASHIDLGLDAQTLDLTEFRAHAETSHDPFLSADF